jgi:phytoene synthase
MDALYAFMRVTDDLADEPGDPAAKRVALDQWKAALLAALGGKYTHPVHPAVHDTARRFAIPPAYLTAVIDGVASDLEPVRFRTFAELHPYCYKVASVVGLACVRVWGLRPGATWDEADGPAADAGIAFQLTNILRDLGEDLGRGRVYLPDEDGDRFGCPPERWRDPAAADRFRALMRFEAERAHDFYRRGDRLVPLLSADGRAIFRVMSGLYRRLLAEVERADFAVFDRRIRVPAWRKACVLLGAWPIRWGWL